MIAAELALKSVCGGALVLVFSAFAQTLSPKRFAGVFAAAPTVALASLAVTVGFQGSATAARQCTGMLAGAGGFAVYCLLAPSVVRRLGTLRGSAVTLLAWAGTAAALLPGVLALPAAKAAVLPIGRSVRSTAPRPRLAFEPRNLKDVTASEAAVRAGFGAGASLLAGVVGTVAGPVVGGVFLAFPAILLASLTLVAEEEGQAAARDEARGALAGSIGLLAFAATGAAVFGSRPAPASFFFACLSWVAVSLICYGVAWLTRHGDDEKPRSAQGEIPPVW